MGKFDKTIVIVGPTASGKTGVAISIAKAIETELTGCRPGFSPDISSSEDAMLAHRMSNTACSASPSSSNYLGDNSGVRNLSKSICGAEIISADSRAIYKGMDIGTAKPSREEQQGIPHWGIDLVEPGERFTVADFKKYAEEKIADIKARGKIPIVVGGTGLYVDALVYDYNFTQETKHTQSDRKEVCTNFLLIGVKTDPEELRERIRQRVNKLFVQELYDETTELVQKYGWESQAMKSNIYQFAWGYLQGKYTLEEAKELNVFDDWHLAKRQMTWFKRNKKIVWLPLAEIRDFVIKCIQDE